MKSTFHFDDDIHWLGHNISLKNEDYTFIVEQ